MTAPKLPREAKGQRGLRAWFARRAPGEPASTVALYVVSVLVAVDAIAALWSGSAGAQGSGIRPGLLMLAVSGAATVVGGFVGFLFGIPRFDYAAREAAAASAAATSAAPGTTGMSSGSTPQTTGTRAPVRYKPSANLDEIADWLTKIIVGLGLTQLVNVGPGLASISTYVVRECGIGCPSPSMVAAVIVFGAFAGLLFGYLWTRLHYVKLAAAADVETTQTLRQLDEQAARTIGVGGRKKSTQPAGVAPAIAGLAGDDPNKGLFGGSPVANDRALRAVIEPSELGTGLYRIVLTVSSTTPTKPLSGKVTFHLHPTFGQPVVEREVVNGVASLVLVAYGAFTVGAVSDGGQTRLELDLAQNPDATEDFRSR
jgi:pYEATS domain-containing protein involved in immunity